MFSASTYVALAAQLARLVRSPADRLAHRHAPLAHPSSDGAGCCPLCGAFVFVEFAEETVCPQCQQPIESLDALGSA